MEKQIKILRDAEESDYIHFWKELIINHVDTGLCINSKYKPVLIGKSFKNNDMLRLTEFVIWNPDSENSDIEAYRHIDYSYDDIEEMIKTHLLKYNNAKMDLYLTYYR